jgi:hypothetical protein
MSKDRASWLWGTRHAVVRREIRRPSANVEPNRRGDVPFPPPKTAAIGLSILAGAKRHRIEPLAYVSALLTALSSEPVDWESLRPDVWIPAHPEHFLTYRR